MLFPSIAATHALTRVIVVSVECQSSILPTQSAVLVLAVIPATGSHVQFVSVPEDGVHRASPEYRKFPSVQAVSNCAFVPVMPTIDVWSPVFVPLRFVADILPVTVVDHHSDIFVELAHHAQKIATAVPELFFIDTPADDVHACMLSPVASFISGVVNDGDVSHARPHVGTASQFLSVLEFDQSHCGIYKSVFVAGQTTSPEPEGTDHVQSPRRNVVEEGVPVAFIFAGVTTELSIVHTVQLQDTVMSPLSPSVTQPLEIVSILSYIAFFVGTSVDPFHHTPYASSGTLISPVNVPPELFIFESSCVWIDEVTPST